MTQLPASVDDDPQLIRAAGVLVVRGSRIETAGDAPARFATDRPQEFLLLKRPKWWDLPKGHVDPGEDEPIAAFRELTEETGLSREDVQPVDGFSWSSRYVVRERQFDRQPRPKRVMFFLAWNLVERPLVLTEHEAGRWFPWRPPHRVQSFTIDPLLHAAERWFAEQSESGEPAEA